MRERTITDLRDEVEAVLQNGLTALADSDSVAGKVSGTAHASVTISPFNTLSVVMISPAFRGKDFEEKNRMLWSLLEGRFEEAESNRIDFWLLLSPEDAKRVYPEVVEGPRATAEVSA